MTCLWRKKIIFFSERVRVLVFLCFLIKTQLKPVWLQLYWSFSGWRNLSVQASLEEVCACDAFKDNSVISWDTYWRLFSPCVAEGKTRSELRLSAQSCVCVCCVWEWVSECSHCHMFQAAMLPALTSREAKMNLLLPSLIPPYRWLSWWPLTRSFLSGPFLPPRRARRLQGGHGKASLPQRGEYCNCSLRIWEPRCPSEAKTLRSDAARNARFFQLFLSCRDK